jgi:nitroreductase
MAGPLTDEALLHRIIGAASLAPSIHNTQPWYFRVATASVLELHADLDRVLWIADPHGRALHLSCGAALLNLRVAIRAAGYRPLYWQRASAASTLIASVELVPGHPASLAEQELYAAIQRRHSSRSPFSERPLSEAASISLEQAAGFECASLRLLSDRETAAVLRLAAAADRELSAYPDYRGELVGWVGQPAASAVGIPAQALGPQPDEMPGPVRDFGVRVASRPTAHFEQHPQLGVLCTARDSTQDWLRAGQALQRVLLTATAHGLATSLLYQPVELHDMRGDAAGWWPWPEHPQIIVRFGYGPRAASTPRRPLPELLEPPR